MGVHAHFCATLQNIFIASNMAAEWRKLRAEVEEKRKGDKKRKQAPATHLKGKNLTIQRLSPMFAGKPRNMPV